MENMTEPQKALWEKARKGVVQKLIESGGKATLADLHDFSLNKYFIQHQRFSMLMESLVNDGLVEFDWVNHEASITEVGKQFIVA